MFNHPHSVQLQTCGSSEVWASLKVTGLIQEGPHALNKRHFSVADKLKNLPIFLIYDLDKPMS
jgi:hypothetical protein